MGSLVFLEHILNHRFETPNNGMKSVIHCVDLQEGELIVELTNCCEPLQKLRMRLGTCKIDLSPPVFCVTDPSKAILLWWFLLFYVLVLNFLCCLRLMYVFVFFLCNRVATYYENSCSFGLRYVY